MTSEPLAHVLKKRDSFPHLWKLLEPAPEFQQLYTPCLRRWNEFSYREQQRLYWFLREKKNRGETIYRNPLYAITYVHPHPNNWNGRKGIDTMLRTQKMVSAYYEGTYGIYTQLEATIFEMIDQRKLN